jgi:hypothetical protein
MAHVPDVPGNLQTSPLYTATMNMLRKHSSKKRASKLLF